MIDISGHLRDVRRDVGFEDTERSLLVNCSGYQFFNKSRYSRNRPDGRFDYLIIYLYSGKANFLVDGIMQEAKPGDIILYRPHKEQFYEFFGESQTQNYWIHFTGNSVEKIISENFEDNVFFNIGVHQKMASTFDTIRDELLLKARNFEDIVSLQFNLLMKLISRYKSATNDEGAKQSIFNDLILTLNDTYHEAWNVDRMAELCNMSKSRFLHLFKEHKGVSAMQFLIKLRLDKAKELMINSSFSIQDVAELVGYNDPLYFSRLFKKVNGCSPRDYIKSASSSSQQHCSHQQ